MMIMFQVHYKLEKRQSLPNECKTDVISNFRVMDMAVGGEGAPLVPYSETLLYGEDHQAVALQNIGGIGNVTVLPKKGDEKKSHCFRYGSREYDD